MISRLPALQDYRYYFQFTLNPYGNELESHLPSVAKRIETFKRLADLIGKERVVWRYDPILINPKYELSFHKEAFAHLAYELREHTDQCMLGFIDHYRHIRQETRKRGIKPLLPEEIEEIAVSFRKTLVASSIRLNTCTGKVNLSHLGIEAGMCIDRKRIEQLTGYPIVGRKDKNQRPVCNCIESIDIGTYESCLNGCVYCYAIKGNSRTVLDNRKRHDPQSPLLIGHVTEDEMIRDREMKSLRDDQFSLF